MRKILFVLVMALMSLVVKSQVPTYSIDGIKFQPVLEVSITDGDFTGDVVIPDQVTINGLGYWVTGISRGAFDHSHDVTSLTLGFHVKTIAPYAVCGNFSSIKLNASLSDVGPLSFYGCPNLEFIDASSCNYLKDDEGVLYNEDMTKLIIYPIKKQNLKYVIPEGVKYIYNYAFWDTQVAELDIPSTVWFVGGFDNAPNLRSLVVRAETPPTLVVNSVSSKTFRDCVLYVPTENVEDYRNSSQWGQFQTIKGIDELSSVESAQVHKSTAEGVYNLNGIRLPELQPGVNVVVNSEGAKKVIK